VKAATVEATVTFEKSGVGGGGECGASHEETEKRRRRAAQAAAQEEREERLGVLDSKMKNPRMPWAEREMAEVRTEKEEDTGCWNSRRPKLK
jgi:hypothetical protein